MYCNFGCVSISLQVCTAFDLDTTLLRYKLQEKYLMQVTFGEWLSGVLLNHGASQGYLQVMRRTASGNVGFPEPEIEKGQWFPVPYNTTSFFTLASHIPCPSALSCSKAAMHHNTRGKPTLVGHDLPVLTKGMGRSQQQRRQHRGEGSSEEWR